jgi:hypothetical protein
MKPFTISITSFLISASTVLAQLPAIQQVDTVQQRRANELGASAFKEGDSVPTIYAGEESDVGPQSVLQIKPRKSAFEAMADVQYFYTDNFVQGEDYKKSADVLVSTVQLALAPTAYDLGGGKFAPRIGYRSQWFNFGLIDDEKVTVYNLGDIFANTKAAQLNDFDFNAQTFFSDFAWSRNNWIAQAGFDFTRLSSIPGYNEFYKEYVPHWGLQRLFPMNDHATFSIGYEGDYRITSVDVLPPAVDDNVNDRTDHSIFATWTQALCPKSFIQPYYRFTYTHFTANENRDDLKHTFGCGIYYYFTPQISARVFAAYDIRRSDAAQDYEKFDAGGGLNLTFRF